MANPKRKNPKSTAVSYYDSAVDSYPDVSSNNPLPITIISGGGGGGGTEYTEDAAAAANPVGTAVNLIRQDTPSALVNADGDNVAQRGTNYGAAYTQIVSSTGAFIDTFGAGTEYTEGDIDASPTGKVMMGRQISTGAMIPIAVTAEGYQQISTTASVPVDDNGGSITVDAVDLDIRDLASATDSVSVYGDIGILDQLSLASSNPATVAIVDANGDQIVSFGSGTQYADGAARGTATGTLGMVDDGVNIQSMKGDSSGRPLVTIDTSLPAGTAVIGKVSIDQTTPGTTNLVALSAETTKVIGTVRNVGNVGGVFDTTLGSAIPANALAFGISDGTNLQLARNVANGLNTASLGIQAAGLVAQLDDTSPTVITENQFGAVRMSPTRSLRTTIYDNSNERGANVNSDNSLSVSDVRFSTPAALADATANPTTTLVGAMLEGFNGTTWDRLKSDTTNGLDVDVTRVSGTVTVQNTTPVALTASSPATVSVGTTSASAVASNSSRKGLALVNLSNSYIYLAFSGGTAALNSGVTLSPNGGSYEMSPMTFTTGAVNAIADAASSTMAVQEWT